MRIKEFFTVPEGTKVTEKMFSKVLLSSICSILLCMACLASTTWAWFAVSIDNKGNEIQIATVTPIVEIKNGGTVVSPVGDARYTLGEGTYTIGVRLENDATGSDDLNRPQGKVYIVMIVTHNNASESYFFTFDGKQVESKELNGFRIGSGTAIVSFSVSWVVPASATPIGAEAIVIGENPTVPTTAPATGATTTVLTTVPAATIAPTATEFATVSTQENFPETTELVIVPTESMTVAD